MIMVFEEFEIFKNIKICPYQNSSKLQRFRLARNVVEIDNQGIPKRIVEAKLGKKIASAEISEKVTGRSCWYKIFVESRNRKMLEIDRAAKWRRPGSISACQAIWQIAKEVQLHFPLHLISARMQHISIEAFDQEMIRRLQNDEYSFENLVVIQQDRAYPHFKANLTFNVK